MLPRRWTRPCLGSSLVEDSEFPGTPLLQAQERASSFKRNTRSQSWKGIHFTDGKTGQRDSLALRPRAQQWQRWPRTQVSPALTRTLSEVPNALPMGPSLLLLLALDSSSWQPSKPREPRAGRLGATSPRLPADREEQRAGGDLEGPQRPLSGFRPTSGSEQGEQRRENS